MPRIKALINNPRVIAPVIFMVLAASCAPIRVSTDYSHSTNFSNYKTYSWLKVTTHNPLWVDRIKRDVNAQLAAKGWSEVPTGGQAAVTAFGSTRDQRSLETFYDSFGPGFGGWGWRGFGMGGFGESTTQVVNTPVGTLVVDIFNGSNKQLIWRGVARQALSGTPEKNEQKLAKQVADMFKNFPPPPQG